MSYHSKVFLWTCYLEAHNMHVTCFLRFGITVLSKSCTPPGHEDWCWAGILSCGRRTGNDLTSVVF